MSTCKFAMSIAVITNFAKSVLRAKLRSFCGHLCQRLDDGRKLPDEHANASPVLIDSAVKGARVS